jgi:hypothetical protein
MKRSLPKRNSLGQQPRLRHMKIHDVLTTTTVLMVLMLTVGACPSPTTFARATSCGDTKALDKLVPPCGAWWGIYPDSHPNDPNAPQTQSGYKAQLKALENIAGRKFNIVHRYHLWQERFPDSAEREAANGGRILYVAWQSQTDGSLTKGPKWSAIINSQRNDNIDKRIRQMAQDIKRFGKPMFLDWDSEPEQRMDKTNYQYDPNKTPAQLDQDFANSFRHIHQVFHEEGVTNVVWVWNSMGWMIWNGSKWEGLPDNPDNPGHTYKNLYPGNDVVDWIGWDPYNYGNCPGRSGWQGPHAVFEQFYNWLGGQHQAPGSQGWHSDKPLMLSEFGSVELSNDKGSPTDQGQAKARWLRDVPGALQQLPGIKAVSYFNKNYDPAPGQPGGDVCNRTAVTTSQKSQDGFHDASQDPYVNPPQQ